MSRRGRNDNLLGSLFGIFFMIPVVMVIVFKWVIQGFILIIKAVVSLTKWICSTCVKKHENYYVSIANIELIDVDAMDGWSFEYYVAELLRKNGFNRVIVTKGSGDFGVDIMAYINNQLWVFQCKNYSSKLGVGPIQEIFSGKAKYGAIMAVVVTNSYFTDHAKELASSLGVFLWDRVKLAELIKSSNNDLALIKSKK